MNYKENLEYLTLVEDILSHEKFLTLVDYYHHNSSILEHALSVSFLSYLICKKLKLDYVSGARGGLLHDFFLYDWREYKRNPNNKNHGLYHPKVALRNSHECFEINDIECDIILKHMWPKVLGLPKYWESVVVCFADKFCTCNEYLVKSLLFTSNQSKKLRHRNRYRKKAA